MTPDPTAPLGTYAHVDWEIRPLCLGEFPILERSAFAYQHGYGEKFSAPSIGFLLTSEVGAVLVDTGPGAQADGLGLHSPWKRRPEHDPATALRAAGVDPAQLEWVVLSHLHYDHASNLDAFPRATFVVQADELHAAVDPIRPQRAIYEFGYPGVQPPWMTVTDRLLTVRGDRDLLPGLSLLLLPGHTPGMQGVLVRTRAGDHLLASDLVSLQENWGSGGPDDWIAPGIHVDLSACERSFARIRDTGATVLPSHDWRTLDQPVHPAP